jgi:hypothetical protein
VSDDDINACMKCGEALSFDPAARGTTCGGLAVQGALVCPCGCIYLSRASSPTEDWSLSAGGLSVDVGTTRLRAESGRAEDTRALMLRVARLPDYERALVAIALGVNDPSAVARTVLAKAAVRLKGDPAAPPPIAPEGDDELDGEVEETPPVPAQYLALASGRATVESPALAARAGADDRGAAARKAWATRRARAASAKDGEAVPPAPVPASAPPVDDEAARNLAAVRGERKRALLAFSCSCGAGWEQFKDDPASPSRCDCGANVVGRRPDWMKDGETSP